MERNNKASIAFDCLKGSEILKSLRDKVELRLKNEASFDEKDCIIIPVFDGKPKTKRKNNDFER